MGEHVRTRREDDPQGRLVPLAVGNEDLDGRARLALPDRGDRRHERPRPAVGQVVAGDGGHDRVGESHVRDGGGDTGGLCLVERQRVPRVDEAEAARPRAALAVDHEGPGPGGPALVDVRAACLLTHRDEVERAHRLAEGEVFLSHRGLDPQPRGLARADLDATSRVDPCRGEPAEGRSLRRTGFRGASNVGRRRVLALDRPDA